MPKVSELNKATRDALRRGLGVVSVSVKEFGAAGDGVTDDTAAINSAAQYCLETGKILTAQAGDYKITETVTISCCADLSPARFVVYGNPSAAVIVGGQVALQDAKIALPKKISNAEKSGNGWAGMGVGVKVLNCYSCKVDVGRVAGFAVNLWLAADGMGCVYNTINLGHLENGKVNLLLQAESESGWVNENLFFGGRYSHWSNEGEAVADTRHIKMLPADTLALNSWPNNNVFLKPSIEGDVAEFHVEWSGAYNAIISGRWEASAPKVRSVGHASQVLTGRNMVTGGYSPQSIQYSSSGVVQSSGALGPGTLDIEGSGDVINISNTASSAISAPHIQGFAAGESPLGKTAGATNWTYRLYANGLSGKPSANANPSVTLDFSNGRGSFGGGIGVFGATPVAAKPAVSGAKGDNPALASLISALAAYGLIADQTT